MLSELCSKCRINDTDGNDLCSQCNQSVVVTKGIPKNTFCPFTYYLEALKNEQKYVSDYYSLQAKQENVKLCKMKKTILCVQDFKRVWDSDGINSIPFAHFDNSRNGDEQSC